MSNQTNGLTRSFGRDGDLVDGLSVEVFHFLAGQLLQLSDGPDADHLLEVLRGPDLSKEVAVVPLVFKMNRVSI